MKMPARKNLRVKRDLSRVTRKVYQPNRARNCAAVFFGKRDKPADRPLFRRANHADGAAEVQIIAMTCGIDDRRDRSACG